MDLSMLTWFILGKEVVDHINRGDLAPEFLTEGTLLLFHRFKGAYDAKDADKLGREIAKDFNGSFYDCTSKDEVIAFFEHVFAQMSFLLHPQLRITVHHILKQVAEGDHGGHGFARPSVVVR